jgi:hypothetical protein
LTISEQELLDALEILDASISAVEATLR